MNPAGMETACRICGTREGNRIYTVREMMFRSREQFDYIECSNCGCLQIAAIPADMDRHYPPNYYSYMPKQRQLLRSSLYRSLRRIQDRSTVLRTGLAGDLVRALFPNRKLLPLAGLGLTERSRIIDVGCGDGWRLVSLREAGFGVVLGVDPYLARDLAYENGVTVRKCDLSEVQGQWDVVMFHHSFEHVPDPLATLRTAASLLVAGGICLLRLPTVDSYAWKHYREHWYQIDAPRHFYLHSRRSIEILAEQATFHVHAVRYDSTMDQFWRSEQNVQADDPEGLRVDNRMKRRWKRQATRLNHEGRGDQAAFYLVRM